MYELAVLLREELDTDVEVVAVDSVVEVDNRAYPRLRRSVDSNNETGSFMRGDECRL